MISLLLRTVKDPRVRRSMSLPVMLAMVAACSPLKTLDRLVPETGYELKADLAFGPLDRQKLDIYQPQAGIERQDPVVVFFYGGSWKRGDRWKYRFVGQALASEGFTTVVADYRLYPDVQFPAFVEDSAKAVAYVQNRFPNRPVVVMGHSAGAHIAAFLALHPEYLEQAGGNMDRLGGFVGLAGPYAFDPTRYRSTRPVFATARSVEDTKPVNFVGTKAPPSLLIHGGDDTTVYPVNTMTMAEKLEAAGLPVTTRVFDDDGHIGVILDFAEPFQSENGSFRTTVAFLKTLAVD